MAAETVGIGFIMKKLKASCTVVFVKVVVLVEDNRTNVKHLKYWELNVIVLKSNITGELKGSRN